MQSMMRRAVHTPRRHGALRKATVLDLLRGMPDRLDLDELMHRLYLLGKIAASEAAAAEGRVIPHEEVLRRSATWSR